MAGTIGLIVIIGMAHCKHEPSLAANFQPWPDWLKKGQRDKGTIGFLIVHASSWWVPSKPPKRRRGH
jgi:hypothetical protein